MHKPPVGAMLERDHADIDAHFANFARALGAGRVDRESLTEAASELRHHIWVEEVFHFPPLRAAGLMGPIMVMLREHGAIWDALDQLDEQTEIADMQTTWAALAEILDAHNQKEERILYPSGDEVLSEDAAAEILDALANETLPPGWTCEWAGRTVK